MGSNESRTLFISIGVALFAVFLLYSWSQEQKSEVNRKFGATRRVVVASQDIAEMETIDESKLEITELPEPFMQPENISEPDGAVGQVAAVPIKKGEQILSTKLLLPGPDTGLSMEISPGKRAVTLPVDDMRGVSRLLKPGDRIDIIAALDYGRGADQRREVRTILQDVIVLATGVNIVNKIPRRFELDTNGKTVSRVNLSANTNFTSITIEAKPEEVQQLVYILATSPGSLFTTLRHPNDRISAPSRITTVEDVLNKPAVLRSPSSGGDGNGFTQPTISPFAGPGNQTKVTTPQAPVVAPPTRAKNPPRRGNFEEL
jgi:pilus assembly protein CpaB